LRSELDRYLGTDPEHVTDALAWWYGHKHVYPRLHRMALDYLSIPGMLSNPNVRKCLNHQLI
jgi:hAT family C-terminal dimerisation region